MGGRGRWSGGVASQETDAPGLREHVLQKQKEAKGRRTWEQEKDDYFDSQWSEGNDRTDFYKNDDGDYVFKWVGMTKDQSDDYFNANIKPGIDNIEKDMGTSSAIQYMDTHIIDDFNLGGIFQDYRSDLVWKMDKQT